MISFADGASICVDVASDDADLEEKGLIDTVAAEPFATDAADGKIAVTFLATGETGAEEKSVAVCTVPTGSAFADPAKYKLAGNRRVGDIRFNGFSAQDNGDGTTTIRADFLGKQGLLLILR